jgi:hypothetical protein
MRPRPGPVAYPPGAPAPVSRGHRRARRPGRVPNRVDDVYGGHQCPTGPTPVRPTTRSPGPLNVRGRFSVRELSNGGRPGDSWAADGSCAAAHVGAGDHAERRVRASELLARASGRVDRGQTRPASSRRSRMVDVNVAPFYSDRWLWPFGAAHLIAVAAPISALAGWRNRGPGRQLSCRRSTSVA